MALGIIICHALKSILLLLRLTFSEFVEKGRERDGGVSELTNGQDHA